MGRLWWELVPLVIDLALYNFEYGVDMHRIDPNKIDNNYENDLVVMFVYKGGGILRFMDNVTSYEELISR